MSKFEIKRGMCFYLDEPSKTEPIPCTSDCSPQKKRPYMVLSNNKCNVSSNLVHVAPIITREYDPKRWYCVPFKSANNRDVVVDVSAIMLVDKTLLNEAAYTQAVSFYTVNNKILMDNIKTAIQRQFALDDSTARYDSYSIAEPVQNTLTTQTIQNPIPEIHLTINLNGVPITTSVPMRGNTSVPIEVNVSSTVEKSEFDSKKKIAKAAPKNIEENTTQNNVIKSIRGKGKKFTKSEKEYIQKYIKENYKLFSGKMSINDISETLGISLSTVRRYIYSFETPRVKAKKAVIPNKLCKQFYEDYVKYNAKYVVNKYSKYGFKTTQQVYNAITRNKNIQKFKKNNETVETT